MSPRRRTSIFVAFLAAIATLAPGQIGGSASAASTPAPLPVPVWPADACGPLEYPSAVTIGPAGDLFISDSGNDRIVKCDAAGTRLTTWGDSGDGAGRFNVPLGIDTDPAGNVIVADMGNDRIQKFSGSGKYLDRWGITGTADGEFSQPTDVTVNGTSIFVADSANDRIQRFNPQGDFVNDIVGLGAPFVRPLAIDTSPTGVVFLVDSGNRRVSKYSSGGTFFFETWGKPGSEDGQFNFSDVVGQASGIDFAPDGKTYVVDNGNDRIQIFSATGTYLGKWGVTGSGVDGFNRPADVEVGADGSIYVVDSGNDRIRKFAYPPAAPSGLTSDPGSPGTATSIRVRGKAGVDETVRLFTTADCSSAPVAEGPGELFSSEGLPLVVPAGSKTVIHATAIAGDGLSSSCSGDSAEYVHQPVVIPPPKPEEPDEPTRTVSVFDGRNLHIRLKCPARFKPKCRSTAVPVTLRSRRGKPMARPVRVTIRAGHWKRVTFVVKARYRRGIRAMAQLDRKLLFTRQVIRTDRRSTIFHVYKVRTSRTDELSE
ncbi:MAG TPA: hypothetical protein VMF31_01015 [Solirubrobacterales bacterium]|nr:hypothetical protein [Solirubrobacterales bacterium]